jgi:hypothetical protein
MANCESQLFSKGLGPQWGPEACAAWHEAAHAVVARCMGLPVTCVTVDPALLRSREQTDGLPDDYLGGCTQYDDRDPCSEVEMVTDRERRRALADKWIAVLLAGHECECDPRISCDAERASDAASEDLRCAKKLAGHIVGEDEAEEYVENLRPTVRRILVRPKIWGRIGEVASQLQLQGGSLSSILLDKAIRCADERLRLGPRDVS